jgi:hypothetical protein
MLHREIVTQEFQLKTKKGLETNNYQQLIQSKRGFGLEFEFASIALRKN